MSTNTYSTKVAIKEIKITRGNDRQGTEEAWDKEAGALANINKLKHLHITECVAAIRRGDSRYFMFPWADGDSLRDYWVQTSRQSSGPNAELIHEAIGQLRGLADALHCLHYCNSGQSVSSLSDSAQHERNGIPEMQFHDEHDEETYVDQISTKSIRHGDLKPENILRFMDPRTTLGTLKLADMGLAKQHIVVTQDRTHLTSTRYGTVQYEAPEAIGELNGPRSRLYDVWSMGCITLEFIIWLLYGNDELNNFYGQLKGDAQNHCQYFEMPTPGAATHPEVHRVVRK
jgi:serine/threonine protein kinase